MLWISLKWCGAGPSRYGWISDQHRDGVSVLVGVSLERSADENRATSRRSFEFASVRRLAKQVIFFHGKRALPR